METRHRHCITSHHFSASHVLCCNPSLACLLWHRYDAFRTSKRCEQANIHFEKAAVMFNLASLQSQIALQTERTTDAGVKEAAKLFQVRH